MKNLKLLQQVKERLLYKIQDPLLQNFIKQEKGYPYTILKSDSVYQQESNLELCLEQTEQDWKYLKQISIENKIDIRVAWKSYWNFILPIQFEIFPESQNKQSPYFLGVNGSPGSGKTTFTQILSLMAEKKNLNVLTLSIDDFYLKFLEREKLKKQFPQYLYRGPPGTHDIKLLDSIVNQILNSQGSVYIPKFDKSLINGKGDQCEPILYSKIPDIFILEGWFVGYKPIQEQQLKEEIETKITREQEKDLEFATQVNSKLQEYQKTFNQFDKIIQIEPENYQYMKKWRLNAEENMRKEKGKINSMTDQEIEHFIDYFWRALHPTIYQQQLSEIAHVRYLLDLNRDIIKVFTKN